MSLEILTTSRKKRGGAVAGAASFSFCFQVPARPVRGIQNNVCSYCLVGTRRYLNILSHLKMGVSCAAPVNSMEKKPGNVSLAFSSRILYTYIQHHSSAG
jgi:hypothetical protein